MTRIYISGKITGLPDLNFQKFKTAELVLAFKYGGKVYNPHEFAAEHDKSWASYMKVCIGQLVVCNEVAVLDDWDRSRGAIVEVLIAKLLGIPVYTAHDLMQGRRFNVHLSGLSATWLFIKVLLNRF